MWHRSNRLAAVWQILTGSIVAFACSGRPAPQCVTNGVAGEAEVESCGSGGSATGGAWAAIGGGSLGGGVSQFGGNSAMGAASASGVTGGRSTFSSDLSSGGLDSAAGGAAATGGGSAGGSEVLVCSPGTADCDGNPANGCEATFASDPKNCGGCNESCASYPNYGSCVQGNCLDGCTPGYADCDALTSNGCEVNLTEDAQHCGSCGTRCGDPAGPVRCIRGVCESTYPFRDCDQNGANGLETNTSNDVNNCGACGKVCSSVQGTPACSSGKCVEM